MTRLVLDNAAESRATVGAQGNYLYVESATGPFLLIIEFMSGVRAQYQLERRTQIRFDENMRQLEIENRHAGTNTLDVQTGFGQFLPNDDGQKVTLTGQDVSIDVQTPPGQPLEVTGGITDDELRAAPVPVETGGLTDDELRAAPLDVVHVVYDTLTPGGVITGSGSIAANPNRKHLIIRALMANTGIGWMAGTVNNGLALEAGYMVTLETTAAVNITATVAGDKFSFCEVEA